MQIKRQVLKTFLCGFERLPTLSSVDEVSSADVIVFTGGSDINPALYEGNFMLCGPSNFERDRFELAVYNEAVRLGKLMLGVCRGHQLLCALNNGTLYEDIGYYGFAPHPFMHPVALEERVPFADLLPENLSSMHHQAVKSTSLKTWCTFEGLIEGCYGEKIITTQFHPEFTPNTQEFFDYIFNVWEGNYA